MSWWDKYLAPGDLRAQRQDTTAHDNSPSDALTPSHPTAPAKSERIDAAHRARRQNGMFLGGLAFVALSSFVTRRALVKKRIATYPSFATKANDPTMRVPHFTQSNTAPKAEGGLDAAEALFLATLNVGAVFMAGIGAFMKICDIADVEDMREFVKSGVGYDVYGGEKDADKEIEVWFAEVLSRKEGVGNLRDEIVGKMAELEELERKKKAEVLEQKKAEMLEQKK